MAHNRLPIVLAHGIARFDNLREIAVRKLGIPQAELGDRLHYFKRIKSSLEAHGFTVFHTSVDFAGSVDLRAKQLSDQIKSILNERDFDQVHIIAHSMGGLDARHMIVDIDGMAERVASLTTIGTPHLGTSIADLGMRLGGELITTILKSVINLEGFQDLTTIACERFNRRAQEQEASNTVVYRTYASAENRDAVVLPLQASWLIISRTEGENDGLVSVKSQHWTKELIGTSGQRKPVEQWRFPIPADHLNEVGWGDLQATNPLGGLLQAEKQTDAYEQKIRSIYVQIAESLS